MVCSCKDSSWWRWCVSTWVPRWALWSGDLAACLTIVFGCINNYFCLVYNYWLSLALATARRMRWPTWDSVSWNIRLVSSTCWENMFHTQPQWYYPMSLLHQNYSILFVRMERLAVRGAYWLVNALRNPLFRGHPDHLVKLELWIRVSIRHHGSLKACSPASIVDYS